MKNFYECNNCGSIEIRDSKDKSIKSLCGENSDKSKLIKIKKNKAIKKLCEINLNLVKELEFSEISETNKRDSIMLKKGFKHGIKVMLEKIGMK